MITRRSVLFAGLGALLSSRLLQAQAAAIIGQPVPEFRVADSQNRIRQLAEFAGKVVVLEWASPTCPFSRAQYQSGLMQDLQRMAAANGMVWLSVLSAHPTRRDYLAPKEAEAFYGRRGIAATALLIDADGTVGKAYGAAVTPHIFIVGADRRLAYAGGSGDKATRDPREVRASRSYVREALEALAAGRPIAIPASAPFGCAIAYMG